MITFKTKESPGLCFTILDSTTVGVTILSHEGIFFVTTQDANECVNSGEWFDFSDEIPMVVVK